MILDKLRGQITPAVFDTWFSPITEMEVSDGAACIHVPDSFHAEWLESRHGDMLRELVAEATGERVELRFVVTPTPALPTTGKAPSRAHGFIRKFNFGSFRTLSCNRFAIAAVRNFVSGKSGNLFAIWGPPGSGKTHLASAAGLDFASRFPEASVRYVRLEAFFNAFLASLRDKTSGAFKKSFRNLDFLVMDDLQFAQGKPLLQEEIVHTLDSMAIKENRVLMVSSVHPRELNLAPSLLSRLMGCLLVEVRAPSPLDREEFLTESLSTRGIGVEKTVPGFVSEHCPGAMRELEGIIQRLGAYHSIMGGPISLEVSRAILADLMVVKTPGDRVLEKVCLFMGVPVSELVSGSRKRRVSVTRHLVSYILREKTGLSLEEAGKTLGGVHHTAVLYGAERVRSDPKLLDLANRLWKEMSE